MPADAKAPDLLIITAKKIADCVESYEASRYAGHYLITYEAINDTRQPAVSGTGGQLTCPKPHKIRPR
jgi:hypothetical protein